MTLDCSTFVPHVMHHIQNLETLSFDFYNRTYYYFQSFDSPPALEALAHVRGPESYNVSYPQISVFGLNNSNESRAVISEMKLESISQMPNLRSLYVRNEPWIMALFRNVDTTIPIRLTTLHVQYCNSSVLEKFLVQFQGLVDLDIQVSAKDRYPATISILHHKSTLRRLALWKSSSWLAGTDPLPIDTMHDLGSGLLNLRELCAPLPRLTDPFESGRFPSLRFLWVYNMSRISSNPDFEPDYWWIPSSNHNTNRQKCSALWLGNIPRVYRCPKFIPPNFKAVAIGDSTRLDDIFRGTFTECAGCRLYELLEQGHTLMWQTVSMEELAVKYPDLLSPYSETISLPLAQQIHQFQTFNYAKFDKHFSFQNLAFGDHDLAIKEKQPEPSTPFIDEFSEIVPEDLVDG
ncbi:hypothetical protein ABW19_dt0210148 [Dactylella cylindrospora]|nr:hypothetical protein ABW19_dt0210148 [Dactylella cylindrospora]